MCCLYVYRRYSRVQIYGLDQEIKTLRSNIKQYKQSETKLQSTITAYESQLKELQYKYDHQLQFNIDDEINGETNTTTAGSTTKPTAATILTSLPSLEQLLSSTYSYTDIIDSLVELLPSKYSGIELYRRWLIEIFTKLKVLEKQRRSAEKITSDTISKGRLSELTTITYMQEVDKLQAIIQSLQQVNRYYTHAAGNSCFIYYYYRFLFFVLFFMLAYTKI